jgi:nitrogen fixation protein FixH
VRADLVRPTQQGHDFTPSSSGRPAAFTRWRPEFPLAGVWDVRLRAEDRQRLYQTTRRIVVP